MKSDNKKCKLTYWMDEERNTLVKEFTSSHMTNFKTVLLETFTSLCEAFDCSFMTQKDGPHNGDVGLDLGPTKLSPEALRHFLDPADHVIGWYGPDRVPVHFFLHILVFWNKKKRRVFYSS